MFFDELLEIKKISQTSGCSVFVIPDRAEVEIKNAILLKPEGRATITIDQVRDALEKFNTKQTQDVFVLVRPAEKLTEEAENAILKNLEEPQERVHFVLITSQLSKLLPTVLSRAAIYFWRGGRTRLNEVNADPKLKDMAKRFLAAKPKDLPKIAEEITKKKDGSREYALAILAVAIEIAYKTYFATSKKIFLLKIPKLILAYENIQRNGNLKLHLVADLI